MVVVVVVVSLLLLFICFCFVVVAVFVAVYFVFCFLTVLNLQNSYTVSPVKKINLLKTLPVQKTKIYNFKLTISFYN